MRTPFDSIVPHVSRILVAVAVVTFATGCGIFSPDESDNGGGGGGGVTEVPLATSPAILVNNFRTAWEERSIDVYESVLAEDFRFTFSSQDVDVSPGGQGFWDRAAEIEAAEQIFGDVIPDDPDLLVSQITFSLLEQTEAWLPAGQFDDANAPGADLRGRFSVRLLFNFPDRQTTVRGEQYFFLEQVSQTVDGVEVTTYVLLGWEDLGL